MNDSDWNIEPMQPIEFNFIPCEPSFSDYIQNALRRCQVPARIIEASKQGSSYAQDKMFADLRHSK